MNEDIPIDIKSTRKSKKGSKTRKNGSKLGGLSQDGIFNSVYASSSLKKGLNEQSSPKKKYEELKTKYVKLNEHLKQTENASTHRKPVSRSPDPLRASFPTPTAFNHSVT